MDSIAIARETYLYNYNNSYTERLILKFIYEQLASVYLSISLIRLLQHIKYYYQINYPEYNAVFQLFYTSVKSHAIRTDLLSYGVSQFNSLGSEIPNTYMNLINPNNAYFNLINSYNMENNHDISNNTDNSDDNDISNNTFIPINNNMNQIFFLSTIFNIQSNENILHVLNLVNTIPNNDSRETADDIKIKELDICKFCSLTSEQKEKNSDFCSICQENYDDKIDLKILPCGHFFHDKCINPWLLNCSIYFIKSSGSSSIDKLYQSSICFKAY